MSKRAVEHHTEAASHYEQAARHHKEAARHYELGDHERALYHARLATENHQLATHQSAEAGKAHLESYGDAPLESTTLETVKKEMSSPRMAQSVREEIESVEAAALGKI
jgi:hypothetical protein